MNAKMYSSRISIDTLYAVVLAITVSLSVWVLLLRLPVKALEGVLDKSRLTSFQAGLGYGLMLLALFILLWRIWMACRYRPYASVGDEALPLVTVVTPAYNEGYQILETVRSVMASDYPAEKLQVICIDDGSLDDTWHWMLKARDEFPERLQLVRQPENRGKRQALMAGFRRATGEVYVTIDSDSEVLPETLRELVSPFVLDPRVGAVAGNVRVLNRDQGAIPKMMEVYFTMAFDFIRSGQSVFGGVVCSPGALSAYRASVIKLHLAEWIKQIFMGVPANIGEDRALTNCVLRSGYWVVYQRGAVVLTKIAASYGGLRRMLMRWARSNVRENLVMATFVFGRFRRGACGEGWIRFFGMIQLLELSLAEAFKIGLIVLLLQRPVPTLIGVLSGSLLRSIMPAIIYQIRYKNWFGWRWAGVYSVFWVFALSWISFWALFSAPRSGWLTRGLATAPKPERKPMQAYIRNEALSHGARSLE